MKRAISRRRPGRRTIHLLMLLLALPAASAAASADTEEGARLYDVYTRDIDGDGFPEVMVVSRKPFTGRKLVVMVGSDVQTPIVLDEYRRAIRIHQDVAGEVHVATLHPAQALREEGWQRNALATVYGDITGDGMQDMLVIGDGSAHSYTFSWESRRDQLVVQQVLDDETLQYYAAHGYDIALEDMNGDDMDDLVFRKDGAVVDVALVTGRGVFFAEDRTQEAADITSAITVESLFRAAREGDMDRVLGLAGREAEGLFDGIRAVIGDEAFLEELARVEYVVPATVGVNFAQYEMAVPAEDGSIEFFPLLMERSRNGLWKVERL